MNDNSSKEEGEDVAKVEETPSGEHPSHLLAQFLNAGDDEHAQDTIRMGNRGQQQQQQQQMPSVFDLFGNDIKANGNGTAEEDNKEEKSQQDDAVAAGSTVPPVESSVEVQGQAGGSLTSSSAFLPTEQLAGGGIVEGSNEDKGEDDGQRPTATSKAEQEPSQPPPRPPPPRPFHLGLSNSLSSSPNNKTHKRSVSWGLVSDSVTGIPIPKQPKPGIERETSDKSNTSSLHTYNDPVTLPPPPPPNRDGQQGQNHHRRKITAVNLEELVNEASPLEFEAEASILRIIEQRDAVAMRSRLGSSSASVSIIENIPDEALSTVSEITAAENNLGCYDDDDDDDDDGASRRRIHNGGGGGRNSGSSIRSVVSNNTARSKATVPRSQQLPTTTTTRRPNNKQHRRTTTMEEKLSGLASAIDAMNTLQEEDDVEEEEEGGADDMDSEEGEGQGGSIRSYKHRLNNLDPISSAAAMDNEQHQQQALSSHDKFQRNASILYRRMKSPATTGVDGGVSTAANSVSDGSSGKKPNHKKDDDGETPSADEVLDEEMGQGGTRNGRSDSATSSIRPEENNNDNGKMSHCSCCCLGLRPAATRKCRAFFETINGSVRLYAKVSLLYIMFPGISIAAILYYAFDNPPTGILVNNGQPVNGTTLINTEGEVVDPTKASASWWLLYVFARQVVTFTLALSMQVLVVDCLSIHTGFIFKLFGAWPTLFILQSRGWPFVAFFWGVFGFALLSGDHSFAHHWLYFQDAIGLFNESNPSGKVLESHWNYRILSLVVCISASVAVKRFMMGLYLGRKTFVQFSDKLTTSMKKILLISEVAFLAKDIERQSRNQRKSSGFMSIIPSTVLTEDKLEGLYHNAEDDSSSLTLKNNNDTITSGASVFSQATRKQSRKMPVIDPNDRNPLTGKLNVSQEERITQLLGSWEEPATNTGPVLEHVSVNALLQFRRGLSCLRTEYPFSRVFGPASTREDTITSSQEVYERLLSGSECLNFRVLAELGINSDGTLDQQKLKELIKLFRPDRDGTLSMVDFVKSVDTVYRELRLLRASVDNSSKIDSAFESLFNVVFYFVVAMVVLAVCGVNPLELFLSVSAVIVAFAFMIGTASSKYFEGLLFVLIRRPYDIGDGISISHPNHETTSHGSGAWLVKDITLFSTTVLFIRTKEIATLSNGSLADSRIINSTRSTNATLSSLIKFPMNVAYSKLKVFHEALEQFIRNRPREWLGLTCFRANRVEAAEGFVEYLIMARHRLAWVSIGALRNSQATLLSFTVELSKKLDIWYSKPPMPINLKFLDDNHQQGSSSRRRITNAMQPPPQHPTTTTTTTTTGTTPGQRRAGSTAHPNQQDYDSRYILSPVDSDDDYSFSAALRGLQESFAPPPPAAAGD